MVAPCSRSASTSRYTERMETPSSSAIAEALTGCRCRRRSWTIRSSRCARDTATCCQGSCRLSASCSSIPPGVPNPPFTLHTELFHLSGTPVTLAAIIALVVSIVVAVIVGQWVKRLARRFFGRRGDVGSAYAVARIAQYIVVFTIIAVGLDNFGLSLKSIAALGAFLSVGVGFGMQNIVQNFVSGLILLIELPVKQGDVVRTGNTVGIVDEIAMRATRIRTRDGVAIVVPNSELVTGRVVNL